MVTLHLTLGWKAIKSILISLEPSSEESSVTMAKKHTAANSMCVVSSLMRNSNSSGNRHALALSRTSLSLTLSRKFTLFVASRWTRLLHGVSTTRSKSSLCSATWIFIVSPTKFRLKKKLFNGLSGISTSWANSIAIHRRVLHLLTVCI